MNSELKQGKIHPACRIALKYLSSLGRKKLFVYLESFSSCAIEDNRLAEVCAETLSQLLKGEEVRERYILVLAWAIRDIEELKSNVIPDETKEKQNSGKRSIYD